MTLLPYICLGSNDHHEFTELDFIRTQHGQKLLSARHIGNITHPVSTDVTSLTRDSTTVNASRICSRLYQIIKEGGDDLGSLLDICGRRWSVEVRRHGASV